MKPIPLAKYILHMFNENAEQLDKIKVVFLTIFNTLFATIISVQGLVSFLDIKGRFWPNILVLLFAFSYFRMYRLWFVGHTLVGQFEPDEKTEDDKEG